MQGAILSNYCSYAVMGIAVIPLQSLVRSHIVKGQRDRRTRDFNLITAADEYQRCSRNCPNRGRVTKILVAPFHCQDYNLVDVTMVLIGNLHLFDAKKDGCAAGIRAQRIAVPAALLGGYGSE